MILLIDNYDSFVHNLARYLRRLGQETLVVRNDAITPAGAMALGPAAVVVSPGPCTPHEAGCSLELVRQLGPRIPLLGVCLGHQTLAAAVGGKVERAAEPRHGRTSAIYHGGEGLFAGLPSPFEACRYHSLVVAEQGLPECLEITARTAEGTIMALAHKEWPAWGVQFHPESILTAWGFELLANFLRLAGQKVAPLANLAAEERPAEERAAPLPNVPVTF